jgi:hypothetical protein
MKMTVFWDVSPYSLAEVHRRFRDACCLHNRVASTSEKSVNFYHNTWRNIAEDSHLSYFF